LGPSVAFSAATAVISETTPGIPSRKAPRKILTESQSEIPVFFSQPFATVFTY
jgi:hypothetical protein